LRLSRIGEYGFHRLVLGLVEGSGCIVGPGDDAGCLPLNNGFVLLNIDGYDVSRAMLPWNTWYDVGWKAAVASMSDLVAKNARPLGLMASMGFRPDDDGMIVLEAVRGVRDAARRHGALLLGGDTNSSEARWIDVAAVGYSRRPVPRRGARPGDIVAVSGSFGLTGAGFHAYREGVDLGEWPGIREATSRPSLPLWLLDYGERMNECIHAAIDVSDGLAVSLHLLAEASGVRIVLEDVPIHQEARLYAEKYGLDPLQLALYGGEEYEVVVVIDEACSPPSKTHAVGRVEEGGGVYMGSKPIEKGGWDQFLSSQRE